MATTRTLNAFLCIPILTMGSMKAFSLIPNLISNKRPNKSPNQNLQMKVCFILCVASLIVDITILALILHLPELKCGGDSVPDFYVPLGLSTVFPGIFEVILLQNMLSQWSAKVLWTYISVSTIGKILFSFSIILPRTWPYELLTFLFVIDYLVLAASYFLISRRTLPDRPSRAVLIRRALDFVGITICASIFGALGIRERSIWAALNEVLMMLATAFIGHAQPVVNHLPKKQAPENDEIPIILIDSRSQETT